MKKFVVILLSVTMILSLAACSNEQQSESNISSASTEVTSEIENTSKEEETNTLEGNILIVYFSVPETDGVDTVASASRVVVENEVLGNSQYIAQLIQQQVGGDIFRIETVQEYPGTHNALLEFAYDEKSENVRPELSAKIDNLEEYDIIFLGYPIWNSDLPIPLYTFLEEYDFSEKTIIPFTTHGESGFSSTIQTITELQPNAVILENGLSISRNSVSDAQNDVKEWISTFGL